MGLCVQKSPLVQGSKAFHIQSRGGSRIVKGGFFFDEEVVLRAKCTTKFLPWPHPLLIDHTHS